VERPGDSTHDLGARTQSHRTEATRSEPTLERRTAVPGNPSYRQRSVAVRHLQRVPADRCWTRSDAGVRPSACQHRILEWLDDVSDLVSDKRQD